MEKNKTQKTYVGEVVSNKMEKTVKVIYVVPTAHPKYKKVMNKKRYFLAHSEKKHELGEKVTIMQSRPYAKNVKWVVIN